MTTRVKYLIAGLGEILWDLLPQGKQLGGAPANFTYHAQLLGAEGYVITAIGDDDLGKEILQKITKINLTSDYIAIVRDYPTGTVSVDIDQKGKPTYIIHNNVAWDYIPSTTSLIDLGRDLDALCFGSLAQRGPISRETILNLVKSTREECLRIFDINIRQEFYSEEIIEQSLNLCNYLKLNEDEFPLISKMFGFSGSEENIIIKLINRFGLKMIALTKGSEGSSLYTNEIHSFKKSPKVKIIDTVGAGDAFTAALCIGLLNKFPLDKIHKDAIHLAAFVCTQKGATPPPPIH